MFCVCVRVCAECSCSHVFSPLFLCSFSFFPLSSPFALTSAGTCSFLSRLSVSRASRVEEMIGVNSVQGTGKVRMRASGSVKYSREESVRRQPQHQHRSKSLKMSNSTEFTTVQPKKDKVKRVKCAVSPSLLGFLSA